MKGEEHVIEFRNLKYFNEDHFLQDIISLVTFDLECYSNPCKLNVACLER